VKIGFLAPAIATCLVLAPAASSTRADNDSTLTIRLISSPSGFEHFQDRPPHGVDFYRAGSILRNAVPQFGKHTTGDFEGARGTMETMELSGFQRAVNVYRLRLP
jgi:hypothetical protein